MNKEDLNLSINIQVDYQNNELCISEESSIGCRYELKDKKDAMEGIVNFILDNIDPELECNFSIIDSNDTGETLSDILTDDQKRHIYKEVQFDYSKEDVRCYMIDHSMEVDEKAVEKVAHMMTYGARMDCTLDYWSNIEMLLNYYYDYADKRGDF